MTFTIAADYRELERELDRVEDEPSTKTVMELEMALATAFADATAHVHVITGALRGSGKTKTDHDENTWKGQMTWGGPSPGFLPRPRAMKSAKAANRPLTRNEMEVVYAWFEKRRGLEHDFLNNQAMYTAAFHAAVREAVRGGA